MKRWKKPDNNFSIAEHLLEWKGLGRLSGTVAPYHSQLRRS